MKNLINNISWLVLSVMVIITTVIYMCPMTIQHHSVVMSDFVPDVCQAVGSMGMHMGGAENCMDAHLSVANQFLGDIPYNASLMLILILLATVYYFLWHFPEAIVQPLAGFLKHRYLLYRTSIKILIEKKLLTYLGFLGNYTIVSFS